MNAWQLYSLYTKVLNTYMNIITVKEVIVSVTSNTLNPILSGSSLSLTCTVEFTPLLDIPVSVNTVWSGPNGKVITVNTTTPVLKSVTLYTSNVTLDFIKLSDSGDYTCNVSVRIGDGDSIEWTSSANIIVGKSRLKNYYLANRINHLFLFF